MKIAYVGNFTQRHCTEVHLAKTLENLGHEVVKLQEDKLAYEWVLRLLNDGKKPDLVMYTRTWGNFVELEDLEILKRYGIPTVSYHLDLYVGLTRKYLHEIEEPDGTKRVQTLDEVLKTDPFWRTDFVFTPDGDPKSAEVFKAAGVNHYYMKAGVYKPECYLANPSIAFMNDRFAEVLFVGGGEEPGHPDAYGHPEWQYRNELISWLRKTYGDKFTKLGHPQETVRNELLNNTYAASKVVVGDSVCIDFIHENYWSDRVYETLGRGGFLIHPYIKGMEQEFTHGEHLVYYEYGNFDQLKEKIDYYLEHDNEREVIRHRGHDFVKKHCTYHNRLTEMLNIISSAAVVPTPSAAVPIKINLGAGSEPTDGWTNVDWIKGKGIDVIHNLFEYPWPFEDGVADEIKAIDVLEHMPPDQSIKFIEECHRILQDGGKLTIQVPHHKSPNLWIDPTHYRGYETTSLDYFDPETDFGKWYGYYSSKKFQVSAELSHMPDGQPSNVTFTLIKRGA